MAYIIVHGRITRDPELSQVNTKDGKKAVCKFSVAENKWFGEDASFYDCQAWGKQGEAIEKFFKKGKEIVVYGNHEQEPYKDKEGKVKRPWRLNVSRFEFCGSKSDDQAAHIPAGFQEMDEEDDPDSIPF